MHLLILGKHAVEHWKEIKEKAGRIFSQLPLGVRIHHQYATLSGNLTITVIEAEQEEEVAQLMTELSSVSQYEVYPIYEIGAEEHTEAKTGPFDSMHGPI
jgi:uncharacterized protein with GYD domain